MTYLPPAIYEPTLALRHFGKWKILTQEGRLPKDFTPRKCYVQNFSFVYLSIVLPISSSKNQKNNVGKNRENMKQHWRRSV